MGPLNPLPMAKLEGNETDGDDGHDQPDPPPDHGPLHADSLTLPTSIDAAPMEARASPLFCFADSELAIFPGEPKPANYSP